MDPGKAGLQGQDRVEGVPGPDAGLDVGNDHAPVPGEGADPGHATGKGAGFGAGLQGVLGRHKPDHPVETQALAGGLGDVGVALVGRVEAAAVKSDLHAPRESEAGPEGPGVPPHRPKPHLSRRPHVRLPGEPGGSLKWR